MHDHLGIFCEARSLDRAAIDLLSGELITSSDFVVEPLQLSTKALHDRFIEILSSEGIPQSELLSATIEFRYRKWAWPVGCYIRVETSDGVVIEDTADEMGRRAEILKAST